MKEDPLAGPRGIIVGVVLGSVVWAVVLWLVLR